MVIIRPLKTYDARAALPPIRGGVRWSADFQVAVINRQGIVIFEIAADPGFDSDAEFLVSRSQITALGQPPKLDTGGFPAEQPFTECRSRSDLFDLLLDRVITPRGLPGLEFNEYFIKVDWSCRPVDTAFPNYKPRCLLGGLSANYHLLIFDTKERQQQQYADDSEINDEILKASHPSAKGDDSDDEDSPPLGDDDAAVSHQDGWVPVLDITSAYSKHITHLLDTDAPSNEKFNTFQKKMYALAVVDFGWLPQLGTDGINERLSHFITFHANGDCVLWSILVDEERKFNVQVESTVRIGTDDTNDNDNKYSHIVANHKFTRISPTSGILAVCLRSGNILLYRMTQTGNDPRGSQISLSQRESIWEEDEVGVEFLEVIFDPHAPTEGKKVQVATLLVVKQTHYIVSFKLQLCPDRIIAEQMSLFESPLGEIVGFSPYSCGVYAVMHESGKLGWLDVADHQLEMRTNVGEYIEPVYDEEDVTEGDFVDMHKIHTQDPVYTDLWSFSGFALSPNAVLGVSSKMLRRAHDVILIKDVSACTFVSIFPGEDAWAYVKKKYEEQGFFIQKIPDVLQAFRQLVRMYRDYDFQKYNDGAMDTITELKLYLWALRCMGLPKTWIGKTPMMQSEVEEISIKLLREVVLAQEQLLQKHLTNVIYQVFQEGRLLTECLESSDKNFKSAYAILQYLRSKPGSTLPKEMQVPIQINPICSSCDLEIGFELNEDFDGNARETAPGIPGYKWNGQTCPHQHTNSVCVLSLIPFGYTHRFCPYCGCAALMEPAFNQLPFCPFCEEYMRSDPEREVLEEYDDDGGGILP